MLTAALLQWTTGCRTGARPTLSTPMMISRISVAVLLTSCLASVLAQDGSCGVEGEKPCDGAFAQCDSKLVLNLVLHTFHLLPKPAAFILYDNTCKVHVWPLLRASLSLSYRRRVPSYSTAFSDAWALVWLGTTTRSWTSADAIVYDDDITR